MLKKGNKTMKFIRRVAVAAMWGTLAAPISGVFKPPAVASYQTDNAALIVDFVTMMLLLSSILIGFLVWVHRRVGL